MDSVREQEELKPSLSWLTGQGKMPENGGESHLSSARFVGRFYRKYNAFIFISSHQLRLVSDPLHP
jgi:hypothetical protein